MSLEKLEDMSYQDCHNNDILAHIDDASEQKYIEKWAPRAEEELLIINQDSDYSPIHDIDILSEEKFKEKNSEKCIESNEHNDIEDIEYTYDDHKEIKVEKDDAVVKEDIKNAELNEEEFKDEDNENELSEIIDCNDPEIKGEAIQLPEYNFIEEQDIIGCKLNEVFISQENLDKSGRQAERLNNIESISQNNEDLIIDLKVEDMESQPLKNVNNSEKTPEIKRSTDSKALNSSYNNDDNINSVCEICDKIVYSLEKVSANNHIYHKQCFRCSKCRCVLLAGNFSYYNDKPHCKPHYIELFKKRGRYDERDDGETTAPQADINDILTDELPAPDITKNLLAKFRYLEAGAPTSISEVNSDVTHELPAPNTTKNLAEHFSALGKESDRDKNDQKRKPMIEIPRSENDSQRCGAHENEPVCLPKDVVRANDPGQDEMPEQGITKNLVNRFRDMESTGVVSK